MVMLAIGLALGILLSVALYTGCQEERKRKRCRFHEIEMARLLALRLRLHDESIRSDDPSLKHLRFP